MKRLLTNAIALPFWASSNSPIYVLMLLSEGKSAVRRATALAPGFPREDPVAEPPARPVRPIPTDVPAPEPRDIPVRDPIDVPPPEPGKNPKPIRPLPQRTDPKPRQTP
jgi:hypothetical protein